MLSVASSKARKTHIMYQANLSFVQVEKYLHNLLERGLLNHEGDSFYLITEKGLEFLKLYNEYLERRRLLKEGEVQAAKDRLLLESMCSSRESSGKEKATRKISLAGL